MIAMLKRTMRTVILALGLGLALGQAQAATTYNLDLGGIVPGGAYGSFDSGGFHYEHWGLSLAEIHPFTVEQGDTINATITLSESFTIPASVLYTFFDLQFGGFGFPGGSVETSGSTSFFLASNPGLTGSFGTSTSGAIVNSSIWFPPDNGDITFDSVVSSFTVTTLGGPADLTYAQIGYSRVSASVTAVPEPETYAMLLAGLGLLGFAARRRKQKAA
jgi:hypothetical protein